MHLLLCEISLALVPHVLGARALLHLDDGLLQAEEILAYFCRLERPPHGVVGRHVVGDDVAQLTKHVLALQLVNYPKHEKDAAEGLGTGIAANCINIRRLMTR